MAAPHKITLFRRCWRSVRGLKGSFFRGCRAMQWDRWAVLMGSLVIFIYQASQMWNEYRWGMKVMVTYGEFGREGEGEGLQSAATAAVALPAVSFCFESWSHLIPNGTALIPSLEDSIKYQDSLSKLDLLNVTRQAVSLMDSQIVYGSIDGTRLDNSRMGTPLTPLWWVHVEPLRVDPTRVCFTFLSRLTDEYAVNFRGSSSQEALYQSDNPYAYKSLHELYFSFDIESWLQAVGLNYSHFVTDKQSFPLEILIHSPYVHPMVPPVLRQLDRDYRFTIGEVTSAMTERIYTFDTTKITATEDLGRLGNKLASHTRLGQKGLTVGERPDMRTEFRSRMECLRRMGNYYLTQAHSKATNNSCSVHQRVIYTHEELETIQQHNNHTFLCGLGSEFSKVPTERWLSENADTLCPRDSEVLVFTVEKGASSTSPAAAGGGHWLEVRLKHSGKPEVRVAYSPRMTLTSFLASLAGLSGIYFGFSIINLHASFRSVGSRAASLAWRKLICSAFHSNSQQPTARVPNVSFQVQLLELTQHVTHNNTHHHPPRIDQPTPRAHMSQSNSTSDSIPRVSI